MQHATCLPCATLSILQPNDLVPKSWDRHARTHLLLHCCCIPTKSHGSCFERASDSAGENTHALIDAAYEAATHLEDGDSKGLRDHHQI